ncbi:MAG: hypothetical protein HOQ45_09450, partial [Nocardioidaceae bacterium]|nr:hypothetical protein [Nocardioidaceae bacterium]
NPAVTSGQEEIDEVVARRRSNDEHVRILDALDSALTRRQEVMGVLEDSVDVDDARLRLAQLLQVEEVGATAVLDLQFRRLPVRERQKISERRAELLAERETLI